MRAVAQEGIRDNPGFKIYIYIYIKDILRVLVKHSLKKISFPPIPPNFRGNENLGSGGNMER